MVKASREKVHTHKETTRNANAEGRNTFLLAESTRGHKGNERADELAKSLPKRLMPIMIMRKFPILESIRNDQEIEANTGPDTNIHRTHGNSGVPAFKLLQSPSCECDADKIESVWHIILECPRYEVARYDLEHKIETKLENKNARNNGEPERRVEFCHSQRKPSGKPHPDIDP
ncbi:hypothetical protein EVAR_85890_1 [Eumeta japonica]|uniref:RNase H type-1 domain-containing protein n=1 Tax=Eumeta variegata TaxID=151549 RepID=A0A4C2A3X2_EUMVA|nr:hypothetical protein EVAR_85890_1 [Eumeta japonica]